MRRRCTGTRAGRIWVSGGVAAQRVGVAQAAGQHRRVGGDDHAGRVDRVVAVGVRARDRPGPCPRGGAVERGLEVDARRGVEVGRRRDAVLRDGEGEVDARRADEVRHELDGAGVTGRVEDDVGAVLLQLEGDRRRLTAG